MCNKNTFKATIMVIFLLLMQIKLQFPSLLYVQYNIMSEDSFRNVSYYPKGIRFLGDHIKHYSIPHLTWKCQTPSVRMEGTVLVYNMHSSSHLLQKGIKLINLKIYFILNKNSEFPVTVLLKVISELTAQNQVNLG